MEPSTFRSRADSMSLSKALKLLFAILLAGWLLWYFGPAHA
jgi:hypothetical protein